MGFMLWLITALQSLRMKNASRKLEKVKQNAISRSNKIEAKKNSSSKIKIYFMQFLSVIISVVELIPILLVGSFTVIILIMGIIILIFILAVIPILENVIDVVGDTVFTPAPEQVVRGNPRWSENELAIRGMLLTNREKNWYRLIMLYKLHLEKSGVTASGETAFLFALGLGSTESGGNFYEEGQDTKNILVTPTDKLDNQQGFAGNFGLRRDRTLEHYFGVGGYTDYLRGRFVPDRLSVLPTTDVLFVPWASAMGLKHLYGKIDEQNIDRQSTFATANAVMDSFGIKENREELMQFILWHLATAQYHGAYASEWVDYITFVSAMFAASSDVDSKRSMRNWGIVARNTDYSESTFRRLVIGSTPFQRIDRVRTPTELVLPEMFAHLTLNGERLTVPLWNYLWAKYSSKPEMQGAWRTAQALASRTDDTTVGWGYVARVLNFHYGINSYLQGLRVYTHITSQLVGDFEETVGEAQGTWDGVPLLEYIKRFSGSSVDKALRFQEYWGSARFIGAQRIGRTDWSPDKWGVPFFRQGGNSEIYSRVPWGSRGNTFDVNGCMLYSYAYVASALTGRIINPPEITSVAYLHDALDADAGVIIRNMIPVFESLGLKKELDRFSAGTKVRATPERFNQVWDRVDTTLKNNGLVVVTGVGQWASRGQIHFFVISDRVVEDGKVMYRVYTSSRVDQTVRLWDRSVFEKTLGGVVSFITR